MNQLIFSYETGEEMVLNMGPHHPSTHGVLRFVIKTDGEIMREAIPVVGYLHRGIEKIAEGMPYESLMPYMDRIDYVSAMTACHCWSEAVEKLAGHEVPERAHYLRVIASELNRISSHAICVGVMAMDIGAITPFPYLLRERETINDLFEELCGNRLTYNYFRVGGVSADLPAGWEHRCRKFLDHFDNVVPELDRLITDNEIFVDRTANICAIPPEQAIAYGLVGPNLRASGVDYDVRRDIPYAVYDKLDFDVVVGSGTVGTLGDCWDRFWVRVEEMRQSARIVRQCLDQMPEGPIYSKPKRLRPTGEAWTRVESSRGDMFCYVVGDGKPTPERMHLRTGSYNAMQVVRPQSRGVMVADLVALIASLDVIAPEIDR
jgi:NADH-quinone oxidoreductase subunit D